MSWLGRVFGRSQPQLPPAPQKRLDGYSNLISGLNTLRDKRTYATADYEPLSDIEARNLWLTDDMARRIIETYPDEIMRRGYQIKTDDKEQAEEVDAAAEDLGLDKTFVDALQWRNAYGGSAIFPVIDGAQGDLATPLDEAKINKVVALHLLEPRELHPSSWYDSLSDKKFGQPQRYRVVPITSGGTPAKEMMAEIHESRLVIFQGIKVSRLHQPGNRIGWGDNVLTAVAGVLRDFHQTWGAVANLMTDFAQAVLQIEGLGTMVAMDQDAHARDRLAQIDLLRSFMRMIVIDKNDSFKREQTPMGGVSDVLRDFWVRLAAAADMPVTRLAGISPAGLNATGESDENFTNARTSCLQKDTTPQLEKLLRLIMLSHDGPCAGVEPDVWSVEWHPLKAPSDKETAETRWLHAQADDKYISNGTLTNEEARSHWAGDTYSADVALDQKAWDAQQKLEVKQADLAALAEANKAAALKVGAAPVPELGDGGQRKLLPSPNGKSSIATFEQLKASAKE